MRLITLNVALMCMTVGYNPTLASARKAIESPPSVPLPSARWEGSVAEQLGLTPSDRHPSGILRLTRIDNTRYGPALVLEMEQSGTDTIIFRRIDAIGGYDRPYSVVKRDEFAIKRSFREAAFLVLDRLLPEGERKRIAAKYHVFGCSIDGELVAVSVETRGDYDLSMTRRSACAQDRAADPIRKMEALFERLFATARKEASAASTRR